MYFHCFRPYFLAAVTLMWASPPLYAAGGKLQETTGAMQFEGSAGGGLVPWAVIAGGGAREETAATVFSSRVSVDNYHMNVWGAALGLYDRVEISAAYQMFDLTKMGGEIRQNILGAKVRIFGDVIYNDIPQLAAGVQYKELKDSEIAAAIGADDADSGTDIYVAMSKAHLGVVFGHNLFWDITVRATRANQFGLLGFGGDKNNSYEAMIEGSVAVFLRRTFVVGMEYRQKPDNLSFAVEDDAADMFVAYIPNKQFNLVLGWVDLGDIAGAENQQGPYLSLAAHLW